MLNRSAMTTSATLHGSVRLLPPAKRPARLISMDVLQATRSDAKSGVRNAKPFPLARSNPSDVLADDRRALGPRGLVCLVFVLSVWVGF
jgi:hypothetical protein